MWKHCRTSIAQDEEQRVNSELIKQPRIAFKSNDRQRLPGYPAHERNQDSELKLGHRNQKRAYTSLIDHRNECKLSTAKLRRRLSIRNCCSRNCLHEKHSGTNHGESDIIQSSNSRHYPKLIQATEIRNMGINRVPSLFIQTEQIIRTNTDYKCQPPVVS